MFETLCFQRDHKFIIMHDSSAAATFCCFWGLVLILTFLHKSFHSTLLKISSFIVPSS